MLKKIESVLIEVREDSPKTAEELENFRINQGRPPKFERL